MSTSVSRASFSHRFFSVVGRWGLIDRRVCRRLRGAQVAKLLGEKLRFFVQEQEVLLLRRQGFIELLHTVALKGHFGLQRFDRSNEFFGIHGSSPQKSAVPYTGIQDRGNGAS